MMMNSTGAFMITDNGAFPNVRGQVHVSFEQVRCSTVAHVVFFCYIQVRGRRLFFFSLVLSSSFGPPAPLDADACFIWSSL